MMTGVVNFRGEAIVRLVVGNQNTKTIVLDAVIDTGYTGHLTLPPSIIDALDLVWLGSEDGILGDGSTCKFDVYSAQIIWDGQFRTIKINESDAESLLGTGLLYGYEVCIQTVQGGFVSIKALAL